jgi:Phosphoglucomutase/phosphomannomutase, alpha/beta/alpha domain I
MKISALAGKPAPRNMLVDLAQLERQYYERRPDIEDPGQLVGFGTSGHRGSSRRGTFTEAHILAITQAICDYRRSRRIDGPLYMGRDTHGLSAPAQRTALDRLRAVVRCAGRQQVVHPGCRRGGCHRRARITEPSVSRSYRRTAQGARCG